MNSDAQDAASKRWNGARALSRGTPLRRIGTPLRPNGFGGVPLVETTPVLRAFLSRLAQLRRCIVRTYQSVDVGAQARLWILSNTW